MELIFFQSGAASIIYLLFFARPWLKAWKNKQSTPSYFIGLLFSVLFIFGIPLWLWLYGWKSTLLLIISCIGAAFLTVTLIDLIFPIEDKSIASIFMQLPVRALVGGWLANNHARLRAKSITQQGAR